MRWSCRVQTRPLYPRSCCGPGFPKSVLGMSTYNAARRSCTHRTKDYTQRLDKPTDCSSASCASCPADASRGMTTPFNRLIQGIIVIVDPFGPLVKLAFSIISSFLIWTSDWGRAITSLTPAGRVLLEDRSNLFFDNDLQAHGLARSRDLGSPRLPPRESPHIVQSWLTAGSSSTFTSPRTENSMDIDTHLLRCLGNIPQEGRSGRPTAVTRGKESGKIPFFCFSSQSGWDEWAAYTGGSDAGGYSRQSTRIAPPDSRVFVNNNDVLSANV